MYLSRSASAEGWPRAGAMGSPGSNGGGLLYSRSMLGMTLARCAAMAREARDDLAPTKVGLIDGVDHLHHAASHLLARVVVGILRPVSAAFVEMTVGAVEAG